MILAAVVGAVVLAYQPVWLAGFVWDDDDHITRPDLRSFAGLLRIWFEPGATQQYYPLTESLFWLQHGLWGDGSTGYHLTNLALHALVVLLFATLLRRLSVPGAYFSAAIFALHPVHVESVAWVTEQKNTLSSALFLGAVLAHLRFDEQRRLKPYLALFVLSTLAVLAKVVTVTLPFVLLILIWWRRGVLSWRRDVAPLVPLVVAGAVLGWVSLGVERGFVRTQGAGFALDPAQRFLIAGRAVVFYLQKLAWPSGLSFFYPRWQVDPGAAWQYAFPAVVVAMFGVAWAVRSRTRAPLAALALFVVSLGPVLGFLDVYYFLYAFVADHWQYVASLGPIALVGACASQVLTHWGLWGNARGHGLCVALLVVLGMATTWHARAYADAETLYTQALEDNPGSWLAHNNLAGVLVQKGRHEQAIPHAEAAVEFRPDSFETHANLARAYERMGRTEDASRQYAEAVRLAPERTDLRQRLGAAQLTLGRDEEAADTLKDALEHAPATASVLYQQGLAFARLGQLPEAIERYERSLQLDPSSCEAHNNLGSALARDGRLEDAIVQYRESLRLCPGDSRVAGNLEKVQSMIAGE